MHPDTVMEHPACCGVLPRCARWVGNGRVMVLEDVTEAVLAGGIDEPTNGHHQQECPHACGRCEIARGGAQLRVFAEAQPALRMGLACIAGSQSLGGQQGRVACRGRADAPTLLVNTGRSGSAGGGERPFERVDALGRWGALVWSSTRAIAWSRTPRDRLSAGGVSSVRKSRQSLRRIRFPGTRHAAELLAHGPVALAVREPRRVDRALRLGVAVLSVDQHPAVGDPTSGRGPAVSARARGQRGHRLGLGLGERGWCGTHRRRDPGHPRALRLGELLEVVGGIEGTISDQRGRPRRGVSLGQMVLDHRAARVRLTAMATQRWPQDRQAGLGLDHPRQPPVVEVTPRLPAVASGAGHDRRLGLLRTVITAVNGHAGAIAGGTGRGHSQTRGRGGGHETVEGRDPGVLAGIHGTTAGIISALGRGNAGRHASRGGRRLEAPGDEGARLVETPQAIAHHRVDRVPDGELAHVRVLWRRLVSDVAHAKFVNHARDEASVSSDVTAVGWFHDLSSQEEILPPPKMTQISSRVCGMSVLHGFLA